MAKRRVYTGTYNINRSSAFATQSRMIATVLVKRFKEKICSVYDLVMDYYLLFGTLFFVLVMNFVFPDLVHKINTSNEIISLKRMVNSMSSEVSRAEVACLTAADDLYYLQCTMQDGFTGTTKTEHQNIGLQDKMVCTSCLHIKSEPIKAGMNEESIQRNVGFLRRIFYPKRSISQQEITLMSYVYTNSLDAPKQNDANNATS